jgi:hypothetical protein
VHVLDQRILRDDQALHDGRVVLDRLRETSSLELGQKAELAELREPH